MSLPLSASIVTVKYGTVPSDVAVQLEWIDNTIDEDGYYIHRATSSFTPTSASRWSELLPSGTSFWETQSWIDYTGSADTTYWYSAEAFNSSGSTYGPLSTASWAPSPPTGFNVIASGSDSIYFAITASANASDDKHRVWYRPSGSSDIYATSVMAIGTVSSSVFGLNPSVIYELNFTALRFDETAESSFSTTFFSATTTQSGINAGSTQIRVTNGYDSLGPQFMYAFTSASVAREGLYMSAISGSPPISLEPGEGPPTVLLEGDIWYEASGTTSDGNLYIADTRISDGAVIINRFMTVRDDEPDIASVVSRWSTANAPVDIYIGANAVITDEGFVTVNTTGSSGALIYNETWGGGFYMPDSSTISLYGSQNLLIPTGTIQIDSGTLYVYSGSILMNGPGSVFDISGSNITATILGNPIVSVLTGSVATSSLSPLPIDGTFYVNTGSDSVALKADGTFYSFGGGLPEVVDGGTY